MNTQKLGKPTTQRMAILRGLTTDLLWYGKIETTYDRACAVSRLADKYITIAIKGYGDVVTTSKKSVNTKGKEESLNIAKDGPAKLNARRKLISLLYDKQETIGKGEKKSAFKARTAGIKMPLIEKMFDEYAPKYVARAEEKGTKGGYTRVVKTSVRRGDNAQLAIVELV